MACAPNCPDQDCPSYGACLRKKNLKVGWAASAAGRDLTAEKKHQRDLDAYAAARKQGIQPAATARSAVDAAVKKSEQDGVAWQA